jgi:NADH-quinone oxidoreductase subunit L
MTALYTFRMVFLTFFGPAHARPAPKVSLLMTIPLVVLAAACAVGGFLQWPEALGGRPLLLPFLRATFATEPASCPARAEFILGALSEAAALLGGLAAYLLFLRAPAPARRLARTAAGSAVHRCWLGGWGFDWVYGRLLVAPFVAVARLNSPDFIDRIYSGVAALSRVLHRGLSRMQTGFVRWYAAGLALGAIVVILVVVFL